MAKRPSFQFYPSDWLRDMALRSCSAEARALWIDMLCYMVEGYPYGYLKSGTKVILPVNLASMTGLTLEVCTRLLHELKEADVFSINEDGCIYSRRMVRDEEIRIKRAAGGPLGGNPALTKPKIKVNLKDNHRVNLPPEDEEEDEEEDVDEKETNISFDFFWDEYDKKVGRKDRLKKKWEALTDIEREQAISHTRKYKASQPDKQYRKNPESYLNNKSFNDEIINHGDSKKGTGNGLNSRNGGIAIALNNLKSGIRDVAAGGTAGNGVEI